MPLTLLFMRFLLMLYLILVPFYFWESGVPQFADLLLALLLVLIVLSAKNVKIRLILILPFLLFVCYIILTNSVWTIMLSRSEIFVNSFYYIYNFVVVLGLLLFSEKIGREKLANDITNGILLSLILQFILLLATGGLLDTRTTLFFNNPNQLGYYSLLSLAIILAINNFRNINVKIIYISIALSLILVFVSASKGALISTISLIIFYLIINKGTYIYNFFRYSLLSVISILTLGIFLDKNFVYGHSDISDSIIYRLNHSPNHHDSLLGGRGYERIFEFSTYSIFGAGEGVVDRFNTNMELHSTLGNIFFSYGIIGLVLFLLIFFLFIHKNNILNLYPLAAPFIYGLTHNGIRSTFLWILITVFILYSSKKFRQRKLNE